VDRRGEPVRYVDPVRARGPYRTEAARRPDIVVVTLDMVPPEAWRPGPCRAAMRLPNLDRFESESVSFDNAFCNSPLCGPSRATFLTGRYSYLTVNEERAHDGMAFRLRPDEIIFPEYLRSAGYETRHVGKCHVGADVFLRAFGENDQPWDRWAPPIWDDDAYHAYLESLGVEGIRFAREVRGLRQDGTTPGNLYGAWLTQENGRPFPLEGTYPYYLATRALRAVGQVRRWRGRRPGSQGGAGRPPFYLQVDFFAPHQPFMIPSGLEDRERALREAVSPPPSYFEAVKAGLGPLPDEPKIYATYRRAHGLRSEATMRDYLVANLLQIEVLDRALGVLFDGLREAGLYDDALLLLFADHGEMNGERALIDKGVYGHPKVARVPLWVHLPAGVHAGERIGERVSLLDVAPTVLERAGVAPCARLDGESLTPHVEGRAAPHGDFLFEAGWHVAPNPAVAMPCRLDDGRLLLYTWNLTSECDELYDLADPTYRNLARDPAYAAVREALIRRMGTFLRADPRWRCYWHPFRVEFEALLGAEAGDQQMFRPE